MSAGESAVRQTACTCAQAAAAAADGRESCSLCCRNLHPPGSLASSVSRSLSLFLVLSCLVAELLSPREPPIRFHAPLSPSFWCISSSNAGSPDQAAVARRRLLCLSVSLSFSSFPSLHSLPVCLRSFARSFFLSLLRSFSHSHPSAPESL